MKNDTSFRGIIVYEIILHDGVNLILNGIYSTSDDFLISNEIAKRKSCDAGQTETDIVGNYESRYIETVGEPDKALKCNLRIIKKLDQEAYDFEWKNNNKDLHQIGIGIKINSKQIAVSYINA